MGLGGVETRHSQSDGFHGVSFASINGASATVGPFREDSGGLV